MSEFYRKLDSYLIGVMLFNAGKFIKVLMCRVLSCSTEVEKKTICLLGVNEVLVRDLLPLIRFMEFSF
jgi:hypothetical protein